MSSAVAAPGRSTEGEPSSALLDVRGLSVVYDVPGGSPVHAVDDVSFTLRRGEFVGLVGESGSGKSTLGFAVTRLQRPPARTTAGSILFDGSDIRELDDEALRRQRQGGFAMVLQSGMNALNPVRTIRHHFTDVFRAHGHVPRDDWDARAVAAMDRVRLAPEVLDRYPGELSGGMRQRASIAIALSLEPRLMVFDEPTTALDVLVQHAVMETIMDLQAQEGFTALLISHDLGIVLESTQRVMVMHEGRIVEDASSADILDRPRDDYTRMLLSHYADPRAEVVSLPGFEDRTLRRGDAGPRAGAAADPDARAAHSAIVVEHVSRTYPPPRRGEQPVRAVRDVSFTLEPGASLALVGQSGSGKSTIAKLITGIERPDEGGIRFGDTDVTRLRGRGLRELRRDVQLVFQDPYAALNPLHTIEYILTRPVRNYTTASHREVRARVLELLETVGLTPVEHYASRLPHQLSGGQRQRVVIARALASDPQVLIADEPVSMLDVSLRAGVLALIEQLRQQRGISLLYITHDLLSARLITDDILVLHDGAVVERGDTAQVLRHPSDDYTVQLLDAIPNPRGAASRARG